MPASLRAKDATLDRIAQRLARIPAQRRALLAATKQFGGDFDYEAWERAFLSSEVVDINMVVQVTGDYVALVNHATEAVRSGVKLVGMDRAAGRRGAVGYIEAVRADGGFSSAQATTFSTLYATRNRLQHSSPDVEADEVHRQVRVLLKHLPGFVKSYVAWLEIHDVRLA
jgi:hypothetical protein